jgi:hypothetical protein
MAILLEKDSSSQLLKSYLPPFKGTWKTLPPYLLPDDAVQDSLNVTLRGGKLVARLGLESYNRENLGNKILGSFLTVDTTNAKFPLVSTKNKVFRLVNQKYQEITHNIPLNATDNSQVRMTSIQLGTSVYTLYANGVDTVKVISQVDYLLNNITPTSGSIPVLTDLCTSFSRIVGITPPYTVTWCDVVNDSYLNFRSWPSLNQIVLSDTEDSLVAIRPLGTLGLVVYKEGNIFVGFNQSGSNSQAFRFEHRGEFEGPAGINAIVNVDGVHMRMTPTGRIGIFDGTQNIWIADGLWPFLQDDLDTSYASRIFGVYSYKTAEVLFWYPRIGDNGECKGMIIIDLPYVLAGVTSYSYFLGRSNFACSNGLSVRLFQGNAFPLVFGDRNETFILSKETPTDNGYFFPCSIKPGLFRPPMNESGEDIYIPTVELYATRGNELSGTVDVKVLTSNTLENDGTESRAERIDLTSTPVNEFIGFESEGSFLGLSLEWDSDAKFEYKGADLYGLPVG